MELYVHSVILLDDVVLRERKTFFSYLLYTFGVYEKAGETGETHRPILVKTVLCFNELGYRSRYSDWLRAGPLRGLSSSLRKGKNFLFFTSSRPALGSIQSPTQWVPRTLSPRVKRPGREADHSPPTSAEVKKNMDLYIHSPIRLHGVVLN
jgi:hypothetical protein